MKKLFAIIAALAMLLSAAAFAEDVDVSGAWYMSEITMNGASFNPADFNMSLTLNLHGDGTAAASALFPSEGGNTSQGGTWTFEGDTLTVTLDSSVQAFTYADGKLSGEIGEGIGMVLTREKPSDEGYAPADPAIDAAEADYAGEWRSLKIGYDGTYVDAESIGALMGEGIGPLSIVIDGATLTLNGFVFNGEQLAATYADGALSLTGSDPSTQYFSSISAQLLADGTLMLTFTNDEDSAAFIMEKAE